MAADQQAPVSLNPSPSLAYELPTNEKPHLEMPQAAVGNAKAASPDLTAPPTAATCSAFLSSGLCRMQANMLGTRAYNSNSVNFGPADETGTQNYRSQIPRTSDDSELSSSSQLQIYDGCCSSTKKRKDCTEMPLQIPVDNELGSLAISQGGEFSYSLNLTQTVGMASKKLNGMPSTYAGTLKCIKSPSTEESPQLIVRKYAEEAAAGELEHREEVEYEEEGCMTPTARDQRIPQYGSEVSGLVCPPAPKKRSCAPKRRRLFTSANQYRVAGVAGLTADNFNSHAVAERRTFLTDPPDLHNFPECIRALFK